MSWGNAFRYLQKNIFDYTLDTKNINTLLAVLEARRDNELIQESDVIAEPGKKRPLKINIFQPVCEDDGDEDSSVCDSGTALAPVQDWFEINQYTSSAVYKLNKDDIRLVDGNYTFSDMAVSMIKSVFPTVREKLSNDIAALLVGEVGVLPNGQTEEAVQVMNPTTGGMAPNGFWHIQRAYQNSGYSMKTPYILGGSTEVDNWQKATGIATMNTVAGLDMGRARPAGNLYYDDLINQTFADPSVQHILSFSPEMLKFVSYSVNAGIFATDVANVRAIDAMYQRGYPQLVNGGIVDPRTGLLWDLNILFKPCDEETKQPVWTFQWSLSWDIFFMSPRICNIQGLNSLFHWTTCLEQAPECGNNPYDSAASPSIFTVSAAGLSYPMVLQSVQIGAFVNLNIPNEPVQVDNVGELVTLLNELQNNITFANTGDTLRYTGYLPISVVLNSTTLTFS